MKVTQHAKERIEERCGLSKDAQLKLSAKALETGVTHAQAKGRLKKYFVALYLYKRNANNIRVFGEYVFLFAGETLITVLNLPNNLKKLAKVSKTE